MKYAVVTGATSFIGVHLIRELQRNHYHVYAIVRPNSQNMKRLVPSALITILEKQMKDYDSLSDIINHPIDMFYHLSWDGARMPQRDDAEMQQANLQCAVKAMEAANKLRCKVFVGSGSQAEYGKCSGKIDENHPTVPNTEYGKAKLKACETLGEMAKSNGIRFVWTRIFSVYGIYDYSKTLVMSALDKMLLNETALLTACQQTWDFVHVQDVVGAMYLLGVNNHCMGVYNIASGETKVLRRFVEQMKSIANSHSDLDFGAVPYGREGAVSFEPIIDKLVKDTRWRPMISFDQGILEILKSKQGCKCNEKN